MTLNVNIGSSWSINMHWMSHTILRAFIQIVHKIQDKDYHFINSKYDYIKKYM